ncbi:MAG: DEAD/DEAH box helicase [Lentisphaerae bacterium]|nr:DEAD/DEAH box helicase [Lentisphaerota bacterium]
MTEEQQTPNDDNLQINFEDALTPTEENTPQEQAPATLEETTKEVESDVQESAERDSGETMTFADFGFNPEILQGLEAAGFKEPTPIQVKAIPEAMAGRDLIGQALTGTGKTAAFGLPIMNKIMNEPGLNLLVLVPTRELAAQVSNELFKLGRFANIHTAAFTGGQSYSKQEAMLKKGIHALVATPGRLIDLIESGHFDDIDPKHIVVDEADEMLDMGFLDDVKRIFKHFSGEHQTMLFSATMPRPVVQLAETILKDPVNITTRISESTNNDIEQLFFVIEDSERADAVIRLIDAKDVTKGIIFCRTKEETDSLNILLSARGYNVNCLHGDMEQAQRSRVMAAFRRGEIDILVATDVAARGLDVDNVSHVFNYHLPFDSRGYVHRIGRTGRAGKTGTAITLVTPRELRQLEAIRKNVGAQLENCLIPTRTEVTEQRLKKIFQEVHDYKLDIDILNQVQTLIVNQDVMVIIAKLISRQLESGGDQGPEHIGIAGPRLARLLTPREKRPERPERSERGRRFGREDRRDRADRPRRQDRERKPRREYDAWADEQPKPETERQYKPERHQDDEVPRRERKPRQFDQNDFEAQPPRRERQPRQFEQNDFEAQPPRRQEHRQERQDKPYGRDRYEEPRGKRENRHDFDHRDGDFTESRRRYTKPGNLDRPSYEENAPNWKGDKAPKASYKGRTQQGDKPKFRDASEHQPRKGKWESKFDDAKPRKRREDKERKPAQDTPKSGKKAKRNLPPPPPGAGRNWYFN